MIIFTGTFVLSRLNVYECICRTCSLPSSTTNVDAIEYGTQIIPNTNDNKDPLVLKCVSNKTRSLHRTGSAGGVIVVDGVGLNASGWEPSVDVSLVGFSYGCEGS